MEEIKCTAQVKKRNIGMIRGTLFSGDTLTKREIAEQTDLSLATCTVLLSELIAKEQVLELELAKPNGGRPARRFSINPDWGYILCLFADHYQMGRGICCRVYDLSGRIYYDVNHTDAPFTWEGFASVIEQGIRLFPKIKMIGMAVQGITDSNDKIEICDTSPLFGLNLKALIHERFQLPALIQNDMYFTSYGFYSLLDHQQPYSLSVSIWVERCCSGSGSIVDGHIVLGSTRFAGEIANLPYHLSPEEQRELDRNPKDVTPYVAVYLTSTIVLLNPDVVYVTGKAVEYLSMEKLLEQCKRYIPVQHLPQIYLQKDCREEMMHGIFTLSREEIEF
ncbi:MAG: ROK family protein [Eubacteriales bacterium]|nr:ROK family protein [Eubacteriales bacterium]